MYIQLERGFLKKIWRHKLPLILAKASLFQVGYGQIGQDSVEKSANSCEIFKQNIEHLTFTCSKSTIENTRKRCEICSKLTIKTSERRQ